MDKRIQEGCGKSTGDDAVNGQKSMSCVTCPCAVCVKGFFHGVFILGDLVGGLKVRLLIF